MTGKPSRWRRFQTAKKFVQYAAEMLGFRARSSSVMPRLSGVGNSRCAAAMLPDGASLFPARIALSSSLTSRPSSSNSIESRARVCRSDSLANCVSVKPFLPHAVCESRA